MKCAAVSLLLLLAICADSLAQSADASTQADTAKVSIDPKQRQRRPRPIPQGQFTSLDSALTKPDSVFTLLLRGQNIKKLPPGVRGFKNLSTIDLSGCGLTDFPVEVLACPLLSTLNLGDNPIDSVPKNIDSLKNLTRLSLRNTKVTTLPASIGKCGQLTQLELSGSPIQSLPIAELNKLPRLRSIGLGGWKDPDPKPEDTKATGSAKSAEDKGSTSKKK